MFATCRAEFSADPQYTTFAAKHLHSVVILNRFRARPIDHSLPWWEKYVELPSNHQTKAWVSMPGGPKSKPPPVEPTGVSNKVDDERRAPKPGGPSRTLQHHESRSRAALQSCCRIGRFSNRKPRPRRKRLRLSGQVRLWAIRQLGFLNEIQRTFVLDCVT
jgi:hypothetical protein